MKLGEPPRGIIAVGNVISDPYEAPHWVEEKAAQGETRQRVDIAVSRIQDPLQNDPYVPESELEKITIDNQVWSPQSSGIEIKPRSAGALEKLWDRTVKAEAVGVKDCQRVSLSPTLVLVFSWVLSTIVESPAKQPSAD